MKGGVCDDAREGAKEDCSGQTRGHVPERDLPRHHRTDGDGRVDGEHGPADARDGAHAHRPHEPVAGHPEGHAAGLNQVHNEDGEGDPRADNDENAPCKEGDASHDGGTPQPLPSLVRGTGTHSAIGTEGKPVCRFATHNTKVKFHRNILLSCLLISNGPRVPLTPFPTKNASKANVSKTSDTADECAQSFRGGRGARTRKGTHPRSEPEAWG